MRRKTQVITTSTIATYGGDDILSGQTLPHDLHVRAFAPAAGDAASLLALRKKDLIPSRLQGRRQARAFGGQIGGDGVDAHLK